MRIRWFAVSMYMFNMTTMYILTSYLEFPWWARIIAILFAVTWAFVVVNSIDEKA